MPQILPKREPSQNLKESARMPENTRSLYALNIYANIAESTLSTVIAVVRLTGIDGEIQDPEEISNVVEMIWDTGAHGTIGSEDISPEFRNYLTHPIHDPLQDQHGCKRTGLIGKFVLRIPSCGSIVSALLSLAL